MANRYPEKRTEPLVYTELDYTKAQGWGVDVGLSRAIEVIERWKVESEGKAWYHVGPMLDSLIEEIQILKEKEP